MTHLLSDARVVEAAARAIHGGKGCTCRAGAKGDAVAVLAAAVAALPRDELVERLAAHMALCDAFQQSRWHYLHHAAKACADLGLIPEHVTATEEQ